MAKVLAEDYLEGLTEVLGNLIAASSVLAPVLIFYIGSLDTDTIPLCRKTRTDDALAVKRLGNDTKESLYQCAATDTDTIAEVTITLTTGCVVLADLSKVGR